MYIISFAMNNIDLTNHFCAKLMFDVSFFDATAMNDLLFMTSKYLIRSIYDGLH